MIYLNNAATSYPKPPEVIQAVLEYVSSPPTDAQRFAYTANDKDVLAACREKLANLFNVENPNMISFTSGATYSANLVIQGFELINTSHVITSAIEHSSVLRALRLKEMNSKMTLTIVDCDDKGNIDPGDIEKAITSDTKAIIICHASNVVGTAIDLERVSEIAHKEHLKLIVDASQSAGCIPIDVKKYGIDVLIFTGHKSLYGIGGIGGVYINENLDIKPLIVGGTGLKSQSLFQIEERPAYYESGTQNMVGITSLNAGVDYVLRSGIPNLSQKKEILYYRALGGLQSIPNVTIYGNGKYSTPILCFNIKNLKPTTVGYYLGKKYNIVVRSGLLCAPLIHNKLKTEPYGAVRVSFSHFTTEEDIDSFLVAVAEIADEAAKNKINLSENDSVSCY